MEAQVAESEHVLKNKNFCSICRVNIPDCVNYYPIRDDGQTCGHRFHFWCIKKWITFKPVGKLSNQNTCPNCKCSIVGVHTDAGFSWYTVILVSVQENGESFQRYQLVALEPKKDVLLNVPPVARLKKLDELTIANHLADGILRKRKRVAAEKAKVTRRRHQDEERERRAEEDRRRKEISFNQGYFRWVRSAIRSCRNNGPASGILSPRPAPEPTVSPRSTSTSVASSSSSLLSKTFVRCWMPSTSNKSIPVPEESDEDSDDDLFTPIITKKPRKGRSRPKQKASDPIEEGGSESNVPVVESSSNFMEIPETDSLDQDQHREEPEAADSESRPPPASTSADANQPEPPAPPPTSTSATPEHSIFKPPPPIDPSNPDVNSRVCKVCKKSFLTGSGKRKHEKYHSKDFVRPSCVGCGKSFAQKATLNRHLKNYDLCRKLAALNINSK